MSERCIKGAQVWRTSSSVAFPPPMTGIAKVAGGTHPPGDTRGGTFQRANSEGRNLVEYIFLVPLHF